MLLHVAEQKDDETEEREREEGVYVCVCGGWWRMVEDGGGGVGQGGGSGGDSAKSLAAKKGRFAHAPHAALRVNVHHEALESSVPGANLNTTHTHTLSIPSTPLDLCMGSNSGRIVHACHRPRLLDGSRKSSLYLACS